MFAHGPENDEEAKSNRHLLIHSARCNWKCNTVSRWHTNVWHGCEGSSPLQAENSFRGKVCLRCGVRRTRKNVSNWCKVPSLGNESLDRWMSHNHLIRRQWENRWAEQSTKGRGGDSPNSWLGGWRGDVMIEGAEKGACLQCGRYGTNRKNSLGVLRCNWAHQTCMGCKSLPKDLVRMLQAGMFDGALVGKCGAFKIQVQVYLDAAGVDAD